MVDSEQIRVVILQEGGVWVAQCLEYDIGAQAPDLDALPSLLSAVIEAERRESIARRGAPFAGIDPAPKHFFDLWERRSGEFKPSRAPLIKDNGAAPVHVELALCA